MTAESLADAMLMMDMEDGTAAAAVNADSQTANDRAPASQTVEEERDAAERDGLSVGPIDTDTVSLGDRRSRPLFSNTGAQKAGLATQWGSGKLNLLHSTVESNATSSTLAQAGYTQEVGYPLLDRLVCQRPLEELLRQVAEHPHDEGKSAAMADITHNLPSYSNAELVLLLDTLVTLFDTTEKGKGLNFLKQMIRTKGRPYRNTGPLLPAFQNFLEALEEVLVETQPERWWGDRTTTDPESDSNNNMAAAAGGGLLMRSVLHFGAAIHVFEQNLWYTSQETSLSNMADTSHGRGLNPFTAHKKYFFALYDEMVRMVSSDIPRPPSATSDTTTTMVPFVSRFSLEEICDVLSGFAAIDPQGAVPGPVAQQLVQQALVEAKGLLKDHRQALLTAEAESASTKELEMVEQARVFGYLQKIWFALATANVTIDSFAEFILKSVPPSMRNHYFLMAAARHAPLSVTQSQSRQENDRPAVKDDALMSLLQETWAAWGPVVNNSNSNNKYSSMPKVSWSAFECDEAEMSLETLGGDIDADPRLVASSVTVIRNLMLEAVTELLMSMRDRHRAAEWARSVDLDRLLLGAVWPEEEVAATSLHGESAHSSATAVTHHHHSPSSSSTAATNNEPHRSSTEVRYTSLTTPGTVEALQRLDQLFVLHSSAVEKDVTTFVTVLHRLRSGQVGLVVTMSTLRQLVLRASCVQTQPSEDRCRRALTILRYELNRLQKKRRTASSGSGVSTAARVLLVPFSEELLCTDAATTFDEDISMWSVVAKVTELCPVLPVGTILDKNCRVAAPQRFLARRMASDDLSVTSVTETVRMNRLRMGGSEPLPVKLRAFHDHRRKEQLRLTPNRLSSTEAVASQSGPSAESLLLRSTLTNELGGDVGRMLRSKEMVNMARPVRLRRAVRDQPSRVHQYNTRRSKLVFRRDHGIQDKVQLHARHLAVGHAGGALQHNMLGLGIHTPDHSQPGAKWTHARQSS